MVGVGMVVGKSSPTVGKPRKSVLFLAEGIKAGVPPPFGKGDGGGLRDLGLNRGCECVVDRVESGAELVGVADLGGIGIR